MPDPLLCDVIHSFSPILRIIRQQLAYVLERSPPDMTTIGVSLLLL
jgi:hypothetical protein